MLLWHQKCETVRVSNPINCKPYRYQGKITVKQNWGKRLFVQVINRLEKSRTWEIWIPLVSKPNEETHHSHQKWHDHWLFLLSSHLTFVILLVSCKGKRNVFELINEGKGRIRKYLRSKPYKAVTLGETGGDRLIWVCLPWNFFHRIDFLVNMESLKDNHDKLVFECFYHYSHLPFRTLLCHRLFQNKFHFCVLNFGRL